jgi:hypothetical protein
MSVISSPLGASSPTIKPARRFWTRPVKILAVVFLALVLRVWTAWQLPVDADEPVYVGAGYQYVQAVQQDGIGGIIDFTGNSEHPPLVKLLYAGVIWLSGSTSTFNLALLGSRLVSVAFGVISVTLVALLDPLAGLLFAVHSMTVKYTSQAYLEALPQMASLAAVMLLLRSRRGADRCFWLAALFLGLTAASKYSYVPILAPVLFIFFAQKKYSWKYLIPFLLTAGCIFLAFDPSLWRDPLQRLFSSLSFHTQYSQGSDIQRAGYPWYQPLVWLSKAFPAYWHPKVFFYYPLDGWISFLSLAAVGLEWKKRPWLPVWLFSSLLFLLLWPTKWPQYTLVMTPAICLMAATSLRFGFAWAREKEDYWGVLDNLLPHPPGWVKIIAVIMVVFIVLGQAISTVVNAYQQRNWWHLTSITTPLPSNTIAELVNGQQGEIYLATARGLVEVSLSKDNHYPDQWQVFTPSNSALPGYSVQSILMDAGGTLWVGTDKGLARLKDNHWSVYKRDDFKLAADSVRALALDGSGRLWVGTEAGIAVYNGQEWQGYSPPVADDQVVTALAVQGDTVWIGSTSGLERLDALTGNWSVVDRSITGLGYGGVSRLLIDSRSRLWVATLGGGLGLLDGSTWTVMGVANSDIPYNTVVSIAETEPGIFWLGVAPPTEVGGLLVRYDGTDWTQFIPGRSGFSGSEPVDAILDSAGHLWVGTRSHGIDVYLDGR